MKCLIWQKNVMEVIKHWIIEVKNKLTENSLTIFSQSIMILKYNKKPKGKGWDGMDVMKKALEMHAHYSGK